MFKISITRESILDVHEKKPNSLLNELQVKVELKFKLFPLWIENRRVIITC